MFPEQGFPEQAFPNQAFPHGPGPGGPPIPPEEPDLWYLRGGPDRTDELRIPRKPSRYDQWEEWDEDDERDLQLALERLAESEAKPDVQIVIEDKPLEKPRPPIEPERQAVELKPIIQQVQKERGITRKEAIATVTSGLESQLVVAHREQLITDDELLMLLLTVM